MEEEELQHLEGTDHDVREEEGEHEQQEEDY